MIVADVLARIATDKTAFDRLICRDEAALDSPELPAIRRAATQMAFAMSTEALFDDPEDMLGRWAVDVENRTVKGIAPITITELFVFGVALCLLMGVETDYDIAELWVVRTLQFEGFKDADIESARWLVREVTYG